MGPKDVAIVLGGTSPHIELIRQLKERGYRVILVDYLECPPARSHADVHVRESTMDFDAVLKVAKQYNAKLVISACVDQANITACYVAEKLDLPHPYSYELANNITNKGYMKKVMFLRHIPTTQYVFLEKDAQMPRLNLRFPVMVKPADSCAASGVKKADNTDELTVFWENARRVSRTGRTVIEEFATGVEVSMYAFVQNGEAIPLMISERASVIEGDEKVLKCYATISPPNVSPAAIRKIKEVATEIALAFGLDNTPLHVQFIINGDSVSVIEFAPRVGGGISYKNIKAHTGFDIIAATIDSYLGTKVNCIFAADSRCFAVSLLYGVPSVYDHVEGADLLMSEGVVDSIHYHKTCGAEIRADRASAGRIAAILTSGATRKEVLSKIRRAFEVLEAFDKDGNKILRKDLYLKS